MTAVVRIGGVPVGRARVTDPHAVKGRAQLQLAGERRSLSFTDADFSDPVDKQERETSAVRPQSFSVKLVTD